MIEYLTPEELANQVKVSKMTIYRLIKTGKLTSVRIGRSLRVPTKAWEDYLRKQTKGSID